MLSFFRRHLDPAESLSETLFGLIMALTVTLGAGLVAGSEPPQGMELAKAAVGCNLAWGVIDGVFYVMSNIVSRHHAARLVQALQGASDDPTALGFVKAFLEPRIGAYGRPEDRDQLYRSFRAVTANTEPMRMRVTAGDVRGGIATCLLVVATAIPAALPLLLIGNPALALRISNVSQVVLLFVVGFYWSRRAGGRGWIAGVVMMMLGVVLTAIAIALGG